MTNGAEDILGEVFPSIGEFSGEVIQEENIFTGEDSVEIGQILTDLDSGGVVASWLDFTGSDNLPVSDELDGFELLTWSIELSTQFHLIISEVYFDGTDEWIEITNIGNRDFYGTITLVGAKSTSITLTTISLLWGESKLFGDNMSQVSAYQYIAKTGLALNLTDTAAINIQLLLSGQIEDVFVVDQYRVNKYNDKKTSFEKVGTTVTPVVSDRIVNAQSGYIVSPGKYFPTGTIVADVTFAPGHLPLPISCDSVDQRDLIKINEIFLGNEKYPPYIELSVHEDIDINYLSLSGDLLFTGIEFSWGSSGMYLEDNSLLLVSSSGVRNGEWLPVLQSDDFSLVSTWHWLLITIGSWQSRRVMDIVYSSGDMVGKSTYFTSITQQCARVFAGVDDFSPGFEQKFLKYFPVHTVTKIEYAQTSSSVSSGVQICQSTGQIGTLSWDNPITADISSPREGYTIKILNIDYDPDGVDTNNEKITLLATTTLGSSLPLDLNKVFRLKVNGTNKTLPRILPLNIPTTFTKTFGFPNSTASGQDVVVSLTYGEYIFDTYTYNPKKLSSKDAEALTNTGYYVSSVIDGDTFRIKYEGKTQSIRMLGIDAPESNKTRYKHLECFGTQAKDYLKSLIDKKRITFKFDSSQDQRDMYDRLLAYVFLGDQNINQTMIEDGYAKEYTFKTTYSYQSQFRQAQKSAQDQQVGLRNESTCGVSLSGIDLTGDIETTGANIDLSGLQFTITYVLPNPKWSDTTEELGLVIDGNEKDVVGTNPPSASADTSPFIKGVNSGIDLSQGFSLQIGKTKKKIKGTVYVGQENILSGSLGLVNKTACVSLFYDQQELSKFCYQNPKEGQKIYANNTVLQETSQEDISILNALHIKRVGNQMCIWYKENTFVCKRIPASKAETTTVNQKKLYQWFASLIKSYLLSDRKDIYYTTSLKQYFDLLAKNKKLISAGVWQVDIYGQIVAVTNLKEQIHIIETTSPVVIALFEGAKALFEE